MQGSVKNSAQRDLHLIACGIALRLILCSVSLPCASTPINIKLLRSMERKEQKFCFVGSILKTRQQSIGSYESLSLMCLHSHKEPILDTIDFCVRGKFLEPREDTADNRMNLWNSIHNLAEARGQQSE